MENTWSRSSAAFKRIAADPVLVNASGLTALVIIESVQFLILLGLVYSFIPVPLEDFIKDLPEKLQKTILPEREIFLYRATVVFALGAQVTGVYFLRGRFKDRALTAQLWHRVLVSAFWVAAQLFAVFKIWQYADPAWARGLLYVSMVSSVLVRLYWQENTTQRLNEAIMKKQKTIRLAVQLCVPALITLALWIPDTHKAVARIMVWDQFRNWDQTIMLTGMAYLNGGTLNMDIFSPWGQGAVMAISRLAQALGGFDYDQVLKVLMAMAILYYVLVYFFVRLWLKSVLLAAVAVAVAIKLQMFHSGLAPLVWMFPQDTPARHCLDIGVLFCLWRHATAGGSSYLWGAGVGTGLAMAWSLSSGVCLSMALAGYLGFMAVLSASQGQRAVKEYRTAAMYALVPFGVLLLGLFLVQGGSMVQPVFWRNYLEPWQLFLLGKETLPLYASLRDRHFFAFAVGFAIPIVYAWTLIVVATSAYLKKKDLKDVFLVPVCIYGLALYGHYLAHAVTSHYYAVGIPFVLVLVFCVSKAMEFFDAQSRLQSLVLMTALAWGALATNTLFVFYPNALNIGRLDWGPEKAYYQNTFHFERDAAMVARLTPGKQKAAVLSSFEAAILLLAQRPPFFYYAPLVLSQRLDLPGFAGTTLVNSARLKETLDQITYHAPEYIFIEKRWLSPWPPEYAKRNFAVVAVLQFIDANYMVAETGQYLVAMKRK